MITAKAYYIIAAAISVGLIIIDTIFITGELNGLLSVIGFIISGILILLSIMDQPLGIRDRQ